MPTLIQRQENGSIQHKSEIMAKIKFANFAVFIIFFGVAFVEAIQENNWLEASLFMLLGVISFRADFR